jgi:hypothetical protein
MRSPSFSRVTPTFLAAAVITVVLSSCGGSDLLQINQSWGQQSVANKTLPDTVPHSSPVIVITSGAAEIRGDGHYTFTFNGTTDGVQGVIGSDEGTWSISSSTFFFKSAASSPHVPQYIAALSAGTFNVAMPGLVVHSQDPTVDMVFAEIH